MGLELVEFIRCWWLALLSSVICRVLDLTRFKPHDTTVVLAERSNTGQPPSTRQCPSLKPCSVRDWFSSPLGKKKWTVLWKVHLRIRSKDLLLCCHKRMQGLTTCCLFFLSGEWQRLWDGVWTVCTLLQGLSGSELLTSILNMTLWIKHTFLLFLIIQNILLCFSLVKFL